MMHALAQISYLAAAALFVMLLYWMNDPKTARRSVGVGVLAMLLAVFATWLQPEVINHDWIILAIIAGFVVGVPLSRVALTAVHQRTALSHAFGGLAAGLVGTAKYYLWAGEGPEQLTPFRVGAIVAEIILGYLTFTGSLMAAGKLQELKWIPQRPVTYPLQNVTNIALLALAVGLGVFLVMDPTGPYSGLVFPAIIALSLSFGVLLIIPIGGADMPTVIAILNAYAGLSAVAMGFVLDNKLLITAGALDGSSGLILSVDILILKSYLLFVMCVMFFYALRHFLFAINRSFGEQRIYYHDIVDSELPFISVLIPMHNEEKIAMHILNRLISTDYPPDRMEVIPINDHSTDRTGEMLDEYAAKYTRIKPMHRNSGERGKPVGLNDALRIAQGEIIIIFDADYLPPKGILKDIAISFKDPEVGAVMGSVVPDNTFKNLLTRLLDLERSGGYQVDQQARYNLKLIPQYGGTVAGFRKEPVVSLGCFNPLILAEDTELTFKLFINGWKVVYANRIECYEEAPERWDVRARQIRRWARGHAQVMFTYFLPLIRTPHLSLKEKIDGLLLLCISPRRSHRTGTGGTCRRTSAAYPAARRRAFDARSVPTA